ncbi:hypothetical protein Y032_0032g2596 [Ancylostoma ceylanicum]|nr:hypothetical protein Y032_0032g2596 [Ancylostoma ceylanicum]
MTLTTSFHNRFSITDDGASVRLRHLAADVRKAIAYALEDLRSYEVVDGHLVLLRKKKQLEWLTSCMVDGCQLGIGGVRRRAGGPQLLFDFLICSVEFVFLCIFFVIHRGR